MNNSIVFLLCTPQDEDQLGLKSPSTEIAIPEIAV
jgi:hypothetical protein